MRIVLPLWGPWRGRPALAALLAWVCAAASAPACADSLQPVAEPKAAQIKIELGSDHPRIFASTADLGLIWLSRGAPGKAAGRIEGVQIQGEVVSETWAAQYGWRSIRLTLDLSCASRETLVRAVDVYPEHGRNGAPQARPAPGGWMRPAQGAYLNAVLDALCGSSASPDQAHPSETALMSPQPGGTTRSSPAASSAPQTAAAFTAQVNASPNAEGAQTALAQLAAKGLTGQGLAPHVEPAQVGGRRLFRALVSGFPARADAEAFCARVSQSGGDCFVRPSPRPAGPNG